jgi:hypothetical protein
MLKQKRPQLVLPLFVPGLTSLSPTGRRSCLAHGAAEFDVSASGALHCVTAALFCPPAPRLSDVCLPTNACCRSALPNRLLMRRHGRIVLADGLLREHPCTMPLPVCMALDAA